MRFATSAGNKGCPPAIPRGGAFARAPPSPRCTACCRASTTEALATCNLLLGCQRRNHARQTKSANHLGWNSERKMILAPRSSGSSSVTSWRLRASPGPACANVPRDARFGRCSLAPDDGFAVARDVVYAIGEDEVVTGLAIDGVECAVAYVDQIVERRSNDLVAIAFAAARE